MTNRDRGSASIEFIVLALAVLVPVLAITVSTSSIQRAQFAATEISRQGVRALSLSPSTAAGSVTARRNAALILADLGVAGKASYVMSCVPATCGAGALVRLTTTLTVPLVMIPALPKLRIAPRVTVTSTATERRPMGVG